MADITAASIDAVLRSQLEALRTSVESREVGTVAQVGDGIARVEGLRGAMAGELLEFETSDGETVMGMALNLDEREVGAVLLGDYIKVKENDTVRTTGKIVQVPSGKGMLGRIVSPLGEPLDGKGPIQGIEGYRPVEFKAPGVVQRKGVHEPLQTGIMAVDAMIPIGRGQRELIIGDRQTGKTAVAIDTIINQKGTGVICIYVAIGQKASTVAGVVETLDQLRRDGLHDRRVGHRVRRRPAAVHRSDGRLRHRRVLHVQRRGRQAREQGQPGPRGAVHLRRPVQAGRGLPPDVAHAAPSSGTRGLPRRRLLPAQPSARACGQDERRAGRRFAHRPAGHRDPGR